MAITKEMSVSRILATNPLGQEALRRAGIKFIGKELSPLESLERVAKGNGLTDTQIDALVAELNRDAARSDDLASGELLTLTAAAAAELKKAMAKKPGKTIVFRLASDGCGSYVYDMDFSATKTRDEVSYETVGIAFFLEKKTLPFLKGTRIDYRDGFIIENPNAKR